jgi:hypothetical protein
MAGSLTRSDEWAGRGRCETSRDHEAGKLAGHTPYDGRVPQRLYNPSRNSIFVLIVLRDLAEPTN